MKHAELRSDEDLTRETMHLACIYGWISKGWDQQRYGCKIDKSPFPDSGDLIADQMEASRIVNAMDRQPNPINHWLFYSYGDDHALDFQWHGRMLAYELWCKVFDKQNDTAYNLVGISIKDFRRRVNGFPPLSEEVLTEVTGSKQWAWKKYWKPKFEQCLDQIKNWDVTGVANVSTVIKEIRDGTART